MYCVLVDRFPQLLLYTWGRHYNYDGDDGDDDDDDDDYDDDDDDDDDYDDDDDDDELIMIDDEMIMIDDDKACSYVSWYVWYILSKWFS